MPEFKRTCYREDIEDKPVRIIERKERTSSTMFIANEQLKTTIMPDKEFFIEILEETNRILRKL